MAEDAASAGVVSGAQPRRDALPPRLVILSWNVWVGRGRLTDVVGRLRDGAYEPLGAPAAAPLAVLVQEAFRADPSVPAVSNAWGPRDRPRDFRPEEDIVQVARALRLDLRYAPSMRNGSHRSDRGNAILSTWPLEDATAFELPFMSQRRVVVGATLRGPAPGTRLRVYSGHLDPWGAVGRDWLGLAGRREQARELLQRIQAETDRDSPVVLGADLNLSRGRREPAYRLLLAAGFTCGVPHRNPGWRHTYHMVPRLSIDYLLFRAGGDTIASAAVHRLNEHPRDAGPFVFGSDHHPLLAVVEIDGGSGTSTASGTDHARAARR